MDIKLELENLNELKKVRESFLHPSTSSSFEMAYRNMIDDRIINMQSLIIEELLQEEQYVC